MDDSINGRKQEKQKKKVLMALDAQMGQLGLKLHCYLDAIKDGLVIVAEEESIIEEAFQSMIDEKVLGILPVSSIDEGKGKAKAKDRINEAKLRIKEAKVKIDNAHILFKKKKYKYVVVETEKHIQGLGYLKNHYGCNNVAVFYVDGVDVDRVASLRQLAMLYGVRSAEASCSSEEEGSLHNVVLFV